MKPLLSDKVKSSNNIFLAEGDEDFNKADRNAAVLHNFLRVSTGDIMTGIKILNSRKATQSTDRIGFSAGEVCWSRSTSINVSYTTYKRRTL